jgi:hypothetical protein
VSRPEKRWGVFKTVGWLAVLVGLIIATAAVAQANRGVGDRPPQEPDAGQGMFFFPALVERPVLPPLPPPIPVSVTPPVDFAAIRQDLQAQGLDLALNKIGFHTGYGGNTTGLVAWMTALDAAGVPFFLKSVDDPWPLIAAQSLMQASGVPHTLVYRRSGTNYDVPNYALPPEQAAADHWARHMAAWPPELDPNLVWIETVNEVDKNRVEWLGQFALATAALAQADGYRWAAFGWSSGEPEPSHWRSPAMLAFLRLAGNNPDRLAIALHEYSFTTGSIGAGYPYLLGRFQALFKACDTYGVPRPTVFISEWGWQHDAVPEPATAMSHIAWASWLYAAYPQVRGAALWYLGGGFGGIADLAQLLIAPVRDYSLSNYFIIDPGHGTIDTNILDPGNFPRGAPIFSDWPISAP